MKRRIALLVVVVFMVSLMSLPGLGGQAFAETGVVPRVAGGSYHTVVLKDDGTVWTWGRNDHGQLGDGTTTDRSTPSQVSVISAVTAVACGDSYTVAIKNDGTVWAWGENTYGQLGDGTTIDRHLPVQVNGISEVAKVACSYGHTVAVKNDGTVWAWGANYFGELGDGTTTNRFTPVQVKGVSGVKAAACGDYHTVAVTSDGTIWAWGANYFGQLGDGTTTMRLTPVQVSGISGVTAIACEYCYTVAVKSNGTVWTWGLNSLGQLGDGTTTNRNTPVQVSGISGVTAVACGYAHTAAVTSDGKVWAWGLNGSGQLGDGTTVSRNTAVQVSGISGVTAVGCGWDCILTLKSDGSVWVWGDNDYGQLGDGTAADKYAPVQVKDLNLSTHPTPSSVKINFQPSGAEIPQGYIPDYGETFAERSGHRYGWNTGYTGATRDRGMNTDQRLDTLIMMYSSGKWEMEIENGTYEVTVSVGDPQFNCTPTVNVEGVNYWSGVNLTPNQYQQQTKTVTVSDGRLTLDNGGTADLITKLNYIEIVECSITAPLQTPSSIQTSTTTEAVTLTWGAVENAAGYEVEADGQLYKAANPEFIHNWLEPNTAHSYRVRAANGTARSEWSNTVTVTTLPEAPGTIKINFQPQGTEIPAGYLPDYGEVYEQRNGFTYGWNAGYTGATRDRGINPIQKLDTLIMMYGQGKWEMQVENGVYDVTICVGDEQFNCTPTVNVEGVNCCSGVSLSPGQHLQVTRTVTVSDGRITVDNGGTEDLTTKLNYIKIVRVNVGL